MDFLGRFSEHTAAFPSPVGISSIVSEATAWVAFGALLAIVACLGLRRRNRAAELAAAYERLRLSEGEFRAAFENAAVGMAQVDAATGQFVRVNDRYCQITGYSADELRRMTVADLDVPSERAADAVQVAKILRGDIQVYRAEKRYLRKGGGEVWVDVTATLIRDEAGRPIRTVAVIQDVSERKAAEDNFRLMADSIPQLAWMARPDGYIFWYNRRWYEYTGATPEDMEGWGWRNVHDPAVLPKVLERWQASIDTGTPLDMVFPLKGADGLFRPFLTRVVPAKDDTGRVIRWFGTNTDVADRLQAEARLQEQEERLRLAVEATGVGIFDYDLTTGRQVFSPEALRMWGFSPETIATPEVVLGAVHPEDRERVEATTRGSLRPGGAGEFRLEHRFIRPDGEVRWISSSGRATFAADGDRRPLRCVGTMLDVTEAKRLEEQLREADRRKDEFLATLAHELRNPLAPICNAIYMLNLVGSQDDEARNLRDMITRQVDHMVRLVDELLDVSRISRGKIELQRSRLRLSEVVQTAIETSDPLIKKGKQRLAVSQPSEPVKVFGDLVRLTQVVANLLNNAAKYTPEGGEISLSVERDDGAAVIRVTDNGIGIPPEMIGQVFRMFTQVNRHLGRHQGGLGIGLTLVKQLVEMHGGTVEARSEGTGRGSEFVVRLPLLIEEGRIETSGSNSLHGADSVLPASNSVVKKVLVVDDNVDAAATLSALLTHLGHAVRTANDGPTAIELVSAFEPDVLLLDLGMPGMDGYEVARRVRQLPKGRQLRIAAVTGWGQEEDRHRTAAAGFDTHLVKPLDLSQIERLLAGSLPPNS